MRMRQPSIADRAGLRAVWATWGPAIRLLGTVLLAAWFAWHTWDRISFFVRHGFPVGIDATIYYRGAVAWLHGGDPWAASVVVRGSTYHYAGSPVTTLLMVPWTLLGEHQFTIAWIALT